MGWNYINNYKQSKLCKGFDNKPRFYFVHSYYVQLRMKNSSMKTFYSLEFESGIEKENIYGVQFHPEKSHKYGMKILKNFAEI